jgi:hypothetical protein
MLDVVSDWFTTWKLSINVNKTKAMHFRPELFDDSDYTRILNNQRSAIDYVMENTLQL